MAKKPERLTAAKFAKLRGVSAAAVGRALRTGRLPKSAIQGSNKRWSIDPVLGIKEWDANTMKARQRKKLKKPKVDPTDPLASEEPPADNPDGTPEDEPAEVAPGIPSQTVSNAVAAKWKAKKAQLDYELLAGKLVYKADAEREAFRSARTARDAMQNISERISAELAAENDPDACYQILNTAISEAMEGAAHAGMREEGN